jgi:IS30 family transposase
MRSYQQLTREQRYQIYALLEMGHSQTEIAETVGMHKASISRCFGSANIMPKKT